MIEKAKEESEQKGRLHRLKEYKQGFLIEKLRTRATTELEQDQVFKESSETLDSKKWELRRASRKAKKWTSQTLIAGLLCYFLILILNSIVFWEQNVFLDALHPIYNRASFDELISGGLIFVVLMGFFIAFILWCLGHFGREDSLPDGFSEKEFTELEEKIYEQANGIVENTRVALEKEHYLHELDPYEEEIPEYASQKPFRKVGERHDEYSETQYLSDLRKHIEEMDKGSIGIAGERGYGKTSLMKALERSLESKTPTGFVAVWLSAPTAISEETFLLSVLAKLATRVGVKLSGNEFWPNDRPDKKLENEDKFRKKKKLGLLGIAIASVLSIFLLVINWEGYEQSVPPYGSFKIELCDLVLLYVAIFGFYFFLLFKRRFGVNRRFPFVHEMKRPLVAASADLLEELWYERKDTLSSEVSLSQFGVSLGGSTGTEKTRQPFTLPHLIQMWDDYVGHVTNTGLGGFEKVIVFIDEIDKIKDPYRIGEFMRILKALYNPMNLFFIVSISDDAYNGFQTRMSSTKERNEFDSSFDHMYYIDRMDYCQTVKLINTRIFGYDLPIPVTQLIWILSKGNPRDAIRLARDVLMKHQTANLFWAAWNLCFEQLQKNIKKHHRSILESSQLNSRELISQISKLDKQMRKITARIDNIRNKNDNTRDENDKIRDEKKKECLVQVKKRKNEDAKSKIRDAISNLRREISSFETEAESEYLLTVCELFCCMSAEEFKKFNDNKSLYRLISSVQECLSDKSVIQAFKKLKEFRSSLNLEEIDLSDNVTDVATSNKSTATSL